MPLTTPIAVLLRLLLGGLLLGAVFGAAYDLLRITRVLMGVRYNTRTSAIPTAKLMPPIKRRAHPHRIGRSLRDVLVNLEDFLFFLAVGPTVAIFLSAANHGRVRWLAFAGIAAGFVLYRLTVGRLVIACSTAIAAVLRVMFAWALWLITRPFCLLGRLICRLAHRLWRLLYLPIYTRLAMRRCLRQLHRAFQTTCEEGSL